MPIEALQQYGGANHSLCQTQPRAEAAARTCAEGEPTKGGWSPASGRVVQPALRIERVRIQPPAARVTPEEVRGPTERRPSRHRLALYNSVRNRRAAHKWHGRVEAEDLSGDGRRVRQLGAHLFQSEPREVHPIRLLSRRGERLGMTRFVQQEDRCGERGGCRIRTSDNEVKEDGLDVVVGQGRLAHQHGEQITGPDLASNLAFTLTFGRLPCGLLDTSSLVDHLRHQLTKTRQELLCDPAVVE